jgi:hypothetical protein
MKNPQQCDHEIPQPEKLKFWNKFGGGALSIAIIIHVMLAIVGGILVCQVILKPEKDPDFASNRGSAGDGSHANVERPKHDRKSLADNVRRVTTDDLNEIVSISNFGDNLGGISELTSLGGAGMPGGLDGPGGGLGNGKWQGDSVMKLGDASGPNFRLLDASIGKRCSKEDRLARLRENGGTTDCEEAVVKGLRWLKANQNPDGSWGKANKGAMTGLALLAYFGHCETPASGEFSDSSLNGIVYLINKGVENNGILTPNVTAQSAPYEHAIATYALGEAATFCKELRIPSLMEVTQKAGQFIIDNQHKNGGWAYGYSTAEKAHTDSSIVGWQLQALKACSHSGIQYKNMDAAVKRGLEYLSGLQNENGGFGYNSKAVRPGLAGVGTLCFQMWGRDKSPEARKGVKFIKENFKFDWNTADSDLYSHYYASQAMMHAGGSYWKSYNDLFRDQLINNQNPDGSWKAPAFTGHGQTADNVVYRNALCILMLEVYYRFLNTSGGGRSGRPEF